MYVESRAGGPAKRSRHKIPSARAATLSSASRLFSCRGPLEGIHWNSFPHPPPSRHIGQFPTFRSLLKNTNRAYHCIKKGYSSCQDFSGIALPCSLEKFEDLVVIHLFDANQHVLCELSTRNIRSRAFPSHKSISQPARTLEVSAGTKSLNEAAENTKPYHTK